MRTPNAGSTRAGSAGRRPPLGRALHPLLAACALAGALALPAGAQDARRADGPPAQPGLAVERLELKETRVSDALRFLAELADLNVVVTPAAGERTVSLFLRDVPARRALEAICKVSGLWYREDGGILGS